MPRSPSGSEMGASFFWGCSVVSQESEQGRRDVRDSKMTEPRRIDGAGRVGRWNWVGDGGFFWRFFVAFVADF